jgi:hypothetical protein
MPIYETRIDSDEVVEPREGPTSRASPGFTCAKDLPKIYSHGRTVFNMIAAYAVYLWRQITRAYTIGSGSAREMKSGADGGGWLCLPRVGNFRSQGKAGLRRSSGHCRGLLDEHFPSEVRVALREFYSSPAATRLTSTTDFHSPRS